MQEHTAKKFLQDNADDLILLSEKIEAARKINPEHEYSEKSRALAIELVEVWISEVFGFTEGTVLPKPPEDNIYRRLQKHRHLDDV